MSDQVASLNELAPTYLRNRYRNIVLHSLC
jgi:hypothetical protein